MSKDYYTITPKCVLKDRNISFSAKVLYGQLNRLQGEDGCWASNQYLAELLGVSTRAITDIIKSLEENNFIKIERVNNQKIKNRKIYVLKQAKLSTMEE